MNVKIKLLLPLIVFLLLATLSLFIGCAVHNTQKDDSAKCKLPKGAFRGRSYHYYERGKALEECGIYEEAANDFRKAINLRADDSWRARTYGMHFEEYFPNRELGVIYYEKKQFEEAKEQLEKSVQKAESSKAVYYLNETYKELLVKNHVDKSEPTITIESPNANTPPTNEFTVHVEGQINDKNYVACVTINDKPINEKYCVQNNNEYIPIKPATIEYTLKADVSITNEKEIVIEARNLLGELSIEHIPIKVDRTGPNITIQDVKGENNSIEKVTGMVSRASDLSYLTINGATFKGNASSKEFAFSWPDDFDADSGQKKTPLLIKAEDIAGNIASVTIGDNERKAAMLSGNLYATSGITDNELIAQNGVPWEKIFKIVVFIWDHKDDITRKIVVLAGDINDKEPPSFELSSDTKDTEVNKTIDMYYDNILIEGEAVDNRGLKSLTINNTKIIDSGERGNIPIKFNQVFSLPDARNEFTLVAEDYHKPISNKKIVHLTVMKKTSPVKQDTERLKIGVISLVKEVPELSIFERIFGTNNLIYLSRLESNFKKELQKLKRKYDIKPFENVNNVQEMLDLMKKDASSKVDAICYGKLTDAPESMDASLWLMDPDNRTIITDPLDGFCKGNKDRASGVVAKMLAAKLERALPIIEGDIIEVNGSKITIKIKNEHQDWKKLKKGMRLLIYPGLIDKGKYTIDKQEVLAEAKLTGDIDINACTASAVIVPGTKKGKIDNHSRFITK
ncbi:MAG: hypothetical protein HQK89_01250 [Nitrospirae bacterium]|nr:hypothetical protein [Nitrospirota bacterium]